jgi:CubicO group peptidase (beta-lactamase class C family)
MYYQGYVPVYINAYAGNGADNYNVIWENTNMKGSDLAKLDAAVNGYMKPRDIIGMSVAVTKDGRLVYAKGFGLADPATKEEMSPNHSLRIMSISKPVTSAGIMKLMEQGKVTMNRKVFGPNSILGAKYPTPDDKPEMNDITVRDLMYHNSGMRTGNGEAEFWDASKSHDDVAKMLMKDANLMTNKPNVVNIYSNLGYFWLMMVIEELSGQSYETFIRNNVLTPSGIGQTMYVGLASGGQKAGEAHYTPDHKQNMNNWAGFGGWVARPMDLLKFLNRVDGSATPADIISAATHDTMTVTSPLSGGYGKGWSVSGERQGHNGSHGGTRSWLMEIGDGLSVAIITNSAPQTDGNIGIMLNEFRDAVKEVSAFPGYNLF